MYFLLPSFAAMEHALPGCIESRDAFVALFLGMQALSYLGSGYMLRSLVNLGASPFSIIEGALVTVVAQS
jgi:hypothetical protein